MASVLSYPRRLLGFEVPFHHVVIVGHGSRPGKTVLLYRWKLNEVRRTIPTVGFNVETVPCGGVDLSIWDVGGGCSKTIPFVQHYFNSETLVLFMIDASQSQFLEEALDELDYMLNKDIGFLGVVFSKRDNEKCKANNLAEWASKVRGVLGQHSRFPSELYDDLDQFSAFTGAQTDELLSRLALAAKTQMGKKKPTQSKQEEENDNRPLVVGNNADVLKGFAYEILKTARSTNQRRGAVINETFPTIQSHIMRLRAQALQAVELEPYSETHAYFWTQMLHAAVESVPSSSGLDITKLSYESFKVLFPDSLAADDDVWKEYYTPKQWTSMEARMGIVLPKLKPLPNVLL